MTSDTVWLLTPEIVLVATAVAIYMGGAMVRSPRLWVWLTGLGIALAAGALWRCGNADIAAQPSRLPGATAVSAVLASESASTADTAVAQPAPPPIVVDSLAMYARWLALALGAVLVLLFSHPLVSGGTSEYLGSLLLALAGLMLVAGAGDLVLLFMGLELISIPTYIVLYLGRRDAASQEAAAKYFFLSILASAMLLYGFSFLYGTGGSTNLEAIRAKLAHADALPAGFDSLAKVALVLVFAGLSFRLAAVPFHFYAPDVYQGTTHANAALLSVVPKAAGLVALVRLVLVTMPNMDPYGWRIALCLSVLSMTLGNLLALWQDNLRRLMAYSSIANAGYMLIGLAAGLASPGAAGWWDGIGAMLFYLCVYAAGTLGVFAALAHLGSDRRQVEMIDELAGLGRTRPLVAGALALLLLSLAGLPPLAGLWGKLLLFGSALGVDAGGAEGRQPWFIALAVIGVLNAVVAAFYYLRIVGVMYFRVPLATPRAEGGRGAWIATVACTVLVLALGVYPGPLVRASHTASPARFASEQIGVTLGEWPDNASTRPNLPGSSTRPPSRSTCWMTN